MMYDNIILIVIEMFLYYSMIYGTEDHVEEAQTIKVISTTHGTEDEDVERVLPLPASGQSLAGSCNILLDR